MQDDLRLAKVRSHVVLFLEGPDEVAVLDMLDEAMDLPGRVRG